eukprot:IDg3874t1
MQPTTALCARQTQVGIPTEETDELPANERLNPEIWQLQCIVNPVPKLSRPHNLTAVPSSPEDFRKAPFGLPSVMTAEQYRADPIWPNLIRAALLPRETLDSIDISREVVNLASASNHRLDVLGIVSLTVTVGTQTNRIPFVVVSQLGADAILGCSYIDQAIEDIKCQKRGVLLMNGDFVPVIRRRAAVPVPHELPERKTIGNRAKTHHNALRCANGLGWHRILNNGPRDLLTGWASAPRKSPEIYDKRRIAIANGIADIRPETPILVRVANFSASEITLPKNMRLGYAVPAPLNQKVMAISFEGDESNQIPREPEPSDSRPSGPLDLSESTSVGAIKSPRSVDDIDLSELTLAHQKSVREMLRPFSSMWNGQLGEVKVTEHRIELLPGARSVFSQPYRAGIESRKVIQQNVDDLLSQDIIQPSKSQFASPVVLAPKSDGSLRFCIGYRRLNAITIKDSYPLPRMDDCLDSLGSADFFTTLDCDSGYWQVRVSESDRHNTAFTSHAGTFQWKQMPFGLCNAPATFQRTLDILLAGFRWKTCLVYLDDVIIFSKNFDEHLQHVEDVLSTLQ